MINFVNYITDTLVVDVLSMFSTDKEGVLYNIVVYQKNTSGAGILNLYNLIVFHYLSKVSLSTL